MVTDLSELARELYDKKAEKETLEEQLKEVNKRIQTLSQHDIPEEMENRDIDKFSVPGIGTVYVQSEVYANVKKDDRERFYAWCRNAGHGDLVVDYVHPQTMKAFVKERLEDGETLPEFINATVYEVARLRRS